MEAKLKDDEVQALKAVLGRIVIRSRTGEVGIMHGMERFVSTQLCMKKQQLDALSRRTHRSASELVRESLRRYIASEQIAAVRKMTMPLAEAQGFVTDEDVFKAVS